LGDRDQLDLLETDQSLPRAAADSGHWSATFVSSREKIAALAPLVRSIAPERPILDPSFYLASIMPEWRPCVVVVSRGQRVAGLLYLRERVVAGFGTHIVVGDDALSTMVVARLEDANFVIGCAVKALIKDKAALRLMVDPAKVPLLKQFESLTEVHFTRADRHAHLELPPTFDDFLTKLGARTRRNLRNFRRKSEQEGNEFVSELPYDNFCAAARRLVPKADFSENSTNFERCLAMIGAMPSRITIALRSRNGDLISVAGGFHDGRRAIVVMQLNDRAFVRASLSLVLRSYLIENLIERGSQELVFWAGSSAPLSAYCVSPELWIAHIDSRAMRWRIAREAAAIAGRLAPRASRRWIKWVVPEEDSEHSGHADHADHE
jgi:hypothetical protein